ncbi:MobP2 family relaxase [Bacillus licheniformis]|uniref:MobP2 family relaxase n=1 Tax=Bacillus licheniformis TaxID=1402 RepID=UPI001CD764AB|nr:MobP2 family relaxase [Bacillus licheniformis]MCA1183067.1 relaxase MobL [Bacillus licheniformis]
MVKNAGVVHIQKFVVAEEAKKLYGGINGYINYIGRKEAVQEKENDLELFDSYHDYMNYMEDEKKSNGLFTKDIDFVDEEGKKELKKLFKIAEQKQSVLWQDVFSFRNEWLEKHGVYDSKTGSLDENKLKNATRKAMDTMLEKEKMTDTAIWTGSIHLNTDNIHIHVATVELTPSRKIMPNGQFRGKIKRKTQEAMKSKIGNYIMDRSQERALLDEIVRGKIIKGKETVSLSKDRKTKKLFKEVINELPAEKKYWQYNYGKIDHVRPKIDEISKIYIEKYHKKDFENFQQKLNEEVKVMREAFGEEKRDQYEKYKQKKIDDLYTRLGNTVLKEMKNYVSERDNMSFDYNRKRRPVRRSVSLKNNKQFENNISTLYALKQMNRAMDRSYEKWRSQQEFERIHGIQNEHEYEIGE